MFTGIIEDLGKVVSIDESPYARKISIKTSLLDDLKVGDSIAVNGVCLTIVEIDNDIFISDVVNETLNLSNLQELNINDSVNLERCMRIDGRINGHLVQGHVESQVKIVSKEKNSKQTTLRIKINKNLLKYCIYKGSICLDGISLTIANIQSNVIDMAIIPHTINSTTLSFKDVGDKLNLETDILAKYAQKIYKRDINAVK